MKLRRTGGPATPKDLLYSKARGVPEHHDRGILPSPSVCGIRKDVLGTGLYYTFRIRTQKDMKYRVQLQEWIDTVRKTG
jgi:hypothetical protein